MLSLTLQAPPELLSLLTAGGGENPSLAVCFAGPCASPSVSGLICRSSKFLAESCYLCTFPHLWLLLKKKSRLLLRGTGARSYVHFLSACVICMEFHMLHLTRNLRASHSGRRLHSQGCHLACHRRCDGNRLPDGAAHGKGIPGVTGAAEGAWMLE